jgi:hypothetical protein
VLLAEFIMHAIKNESISEYKPKGEELAKELLAFVRNHGKSPEADELSDLEETGEKEK